MTKVLTFLFCLLLAMSPLRAHTAALPADPFARLLHRLDYAPVDLEMAAQSSQRGSRMQKAALEFSQTTAPLTPMLENLAKNRALGVMSRVPLVGKPAQWAQNALNGVASLNRNFARLVELDKGQVQPLRDASIAAARLRQTRDRSDLPAAVRSFQTAHRLLLQDEALLQQQRQKLAQTTALFRVLAPRLQKYGRMPGQNSATWQKIKTGLSGVQNALDARATQLSALRRFTGYCALDGQKALST